MLIRKLTSGTEANHILNELARVIDGYPSLTIERLDEQTLAIDSDEVRGGGERHQVEQVLGAISPAWPIHVRIEDD